MTGPTTLPQGIARDAAVQATTASRVHSRARFRVAIFTHDAYGLGHVRRTVRIIDALAEHDPRATVLLLTGSPSTRLLSQLPPGCDYVKLPTIVTSGSDGAKPSVLATSVAELAVLRGRLVGEALRSFQPDVFLVDNFPLGTRLELLPVLQHLLETRTRVLLGLRDVVDPPDKVQKDWGRDGIYEVLERYYDDILVYGMPEVLDPAGAYDLPPSVADKVHFCGYVSEVRPAGRSAGDIRDELSVDHQLLVASVGGGGDGFPLLRCALDAVRELPGLSALLVTGEFMSGEDQAQLRALAQDLPNVHIRSFVKDLPDYFRAADIVLTMGGYNTLAEIMATGARALVVPRTWKSGEHAERTRSRADQEQLYRAKALERLGAISMMSADSLGPAALADRIQKILARARSKPPSLPLDGAQSVARHLLQAAKARAGW